MFGGVWGSDPQTLNRLYFIIKWVILKILLIKINIICQNLKSNLK